MAGEQLYYSNNNFAYRYDEEGRIIDSINGQIIGICVQKKDEILNDYRLLSDENLSLKTKLNEVENLLEKYKEQLPLELQKLIEKPPSVESLQTEISELKNMVAQMAMLLNNSANTSTKNERGASDDNSGVVSKTGFKSGDPTPGTNETKLARREFKQS